MTELTLAPCRWRVPSPWPGRQGCRSPQIAAGEYGVPTHTCWSCPECDHLDQTTLASAAPGVGSTRHCLFHLYPVRERWQWHCDQLRRRISLFNGRRLLAVAVGPETARPADVEAQLAGLGVEVLEVVNNPELKEIAAYPLLLERLAGYRGADVHWYGHGKGVVTEDLGPGCRRWTEAMYEATLDHWPAVRRELERCCCCGIFRRKWEGPLRTRAKWHYSGSFRWVRNADLFGRDWRDVDQTWLGAETHPGKVFGLGESACLYGEFATQDIGLYAESEWERWAEPRRQEWLAAHTRDREAPLLVTVILTAHRQAELVHEAIASVRGQTTDSWELLIVDAGQIAAAGGYDRYREDARVRVSVTGETPDWPAGVGRQAWAINQAWRRGLPRGDLVVHLCDDDTLAPTWLAACIRTAREHPEWSAWYGPAERRQLAADGSSRALGRLATLGVGGPGNSLRCRVDGMQVCHRAAARVEWPEDPAIRHHADGWWMDSLAGNAAIYPVSDLVGVHRHTPLSTFTRPPV